MNKVVIKLTEKQYDELCYQYHIVSDNDKTIGVTYGWWLYKDRNYYFLSLPIDSISDTKKLIHNYAEGSLDNEDRGSYLMFINIVKKLQEVSA